MSRPRRLHTPTPTQPLSEVQLDEFDRALSVSRQILKRKHFVYVMFINSAYISFAKSWVCNLQEIDETVLASTIMFTDSIHTRSAMLNFNGRLNVYTIPTNTSGSVEYGHYDYYALTLHRLRIQAALILNDIHVMLIEADAVWLDRRIDMQLNTIFAIHELISADNHNFAQDTKEISAGFSGYRSSRSVKLMFKRYVEDYNRQLEKYVNVSGFIGDIGEQMLLTQILREGNYAVYWLDSCEYASGAWYDKEKRSSRCRLKDVKVLQNNYIVGNDAKIARAQTWHHWYLDRATDQCAKFSLWGFYARQRNYILHKL